MGLTVGRSPNPPRGGRGELDRLRRIATVGRTFSAVYEEVLGPADPTPSATHHVLWLASEPGGTRPSTISRATRLSPASTTDLLDRIQGCGLVVRAAGTADRRAVIVTPTESGRAALHAIVARAAPLMQPFADAFFPS